MVVCADLAMHSLPSLPPSLPVLPLSLVGYFKPQQASKTTDHITQCRGCCLQGPAEASEPGALLVTEPEVGGRAGDAAGLGFWWGPEWRFD